MFIKLLFFQKITKKISKKDDSGIVLWQLSLVVVFSGITAYLILSTQQNNQIPVESQEEKNTLCIGKFCEVLENKNQRL
ncbi:hypothetical protein [Crocosphaera sp. Alani8]|uniref:hypothetical protein n=1 Tax=Crocosphaera sp. Alani8 TaxID=3038952 RepID=UPI00313CEDF2